MQVPCFRPLNVPAMATSQFAKGGITAVVVVVMRVSPIQFENTTC